MPHIECAASERRRERIKCDVGVVDAVPTKPKPPIKQFASYARKDVARAKQDADRVIELLERLSAVKKQISALQKERASLNGLLAAFGKQESCEGGTPKNGRLYCDLCGRRVKYITTGGSKEGKKVRRARLAGEFNVTVIVDGRDLLVAACSAECKAEQAANYERTKQWQEQEARHLKEAATVMVGLKGYLKTRRREASRSPQAPSAPPDNSAAS